MLGTEKPVLVTEVFHVGIYMTHTGYRSFQCCELKKTMLVTKVSHVGMYKTRASNRSIPRWVYETHGGHRTFQCWELKNRCWL